MLHLVHHRHRLRYAATVEFRTRRKPSLSLRWPASFALRWTGRFLAWLIQEAPAALARTGHGSRPFSHGDTNRQEETCAVSRPLAFHPRNPLNTQPAVPQLGPGIAVQRENCEQMKAHCGLPILGRMAPRNRSIHPRGCAGAASGSASGLVDLRTKRKPKPPLRSPCRMV